jgi:hypothetical protein
LWSKLGPTWKYSEYSYATWTLPEPAEIISPVNGSSLSGPVVQFNWANIGANLYKVYVGTAPGFKDIGVYPLEGTTGTSILVSGLPADGRTVYVRMWTKVGAGWYFNDYTYTSWVPAAMITPLNVSILSGPSASFDWSDVGADEYKLYIGRTQGQKDLGLYSTTGTSITANNLPIDGSTVYVRLWTKISGKAYYQDLTYITGPE